VVTVIKGWKTRSRKGKILPVIAIVTVLLAAFGVLLFPEQTEPWFGLDVDGEDTKLVEPGETVVYPIRVENKLDSEQKVEFETSGTPENWESGLSKRSMTLGPRESRVVFLSVKAPERDKALDPGTERTARVRVGTRGGNATIGTVTILQGTVNVTRDGATFQLSDQDDIKSGDVVNTTGKARVDIDYTKLVNEALAFNTIGNDIGDAPGTVSSVAVGDLDGDDDLDIVCGDRANNVLVWENDGTPFDGSWTKTDIGDAASRWVTAVALGDLDGDDDLDIVSGDFANNVLVWENDGTPFDGSWTKVTIGASGDFMLSVAVGDLDDDDALDIVSCDRVGNVFVWENDGSPWDGSWTKLTIGNAEDAVPSVALGDLDGDDNLDIVAGDGLNNMFAWKNDGTPFDGSWTRTEIGDAGERVTSVAVGDLDGDDDLDIVSGDGDPISGKDGNVSVWKNDGTPFDGSWTGVDISDAERYVSSVAVGDLDGDDNLDIVSGDYDDKVLAWQNDGSPFDGSWTKTDIGDAPNKVFSVAVGDLDGDGDPDIVSGDVGKNVLVWQNTHTTISEQRNIYVLLEDAEVAFLLRDNAIYMTVNRGKATVLVEGGGGGRSRAASNDPTVDLGENSLIDDAFPDMDYNAVLDFGSLLERAFFHLDVTEEETKVEVFDGMLDLKSNKTTRSLDKFEQATAQKEVAVPEPTPVERLIIMVDTGEGATGVVKSQGKNVLDMDDVYHLPTEEREFYVVPYVPELTVDLEGEQTGEYEIAIIQIGEQTSKSFTVSSTTTESTTDTLVFTNDTLKMENMEEGKTYDLKIAHEDARTGEVEEFEVTEVRTSEEEQEFTVEDWEKLEDTEEAPVVVKEGDKEAKITTGSTGEEIEEQLAEADEDDEGKFPAIFLFLGVVIILIVLGLAMQQGYLPIGGEVKIEEGYFALTRFHMSPAPPKQGEETKIKTVLRYTGPRLKPGKHTILVSLFDGYEPIYDGHIISDQDLRDGSRAKIPLTTWTPEEGGERVITVLVEVDGTQINEHPKTVVVEQEEDRGSLQDSEDEHYSRLEDSEETINTAESVDDNEERRSLEDSVKDEEQW